MSSSNFPTVGRSLDKRYSNPTEFIDRHTKASSSCSAKALYRHEDKEEFYKKHGTSWKG